MNPTKTVYMVYYREPSGSGYQWKYQASSKEQGQEIVNAKEKVERRVLAIPADRTYITVEAEQNAESYTKGLQQRYVLILAGAVAYLIVYLALWLVVLKRKKKAAALEQQEQQGQQAQ